MMRYTFLLVGLLAASLALTGCEEEVDATFDASRPYTLYGTLDPTAGRVAVRVIPIRERLEPLPPGPLDATARLVDLANGSVTPLRDSVLTFPGGLGGNVAFAEADLAYGRGYRVEVERADGVTTSATVSVPPLSVGQTRPNRFLAGQRVAAPVRWPQAPNILRARTTYRVENAACQILTVERPYTGEILPIQGGFDTELLLSADATFIANEWGEEPALIDVTVHVQIASSEWAPPGGVFDPEALVEPGVFSNVENGFGFVGSAYWTSHTWQPQFDQPQRFYQETRFRPRVVGACG